MNADNGESTVRKMGDEKSASDTDLIGMGTISDGSEGGVRIDSAGNREQEDSFDNDGLEDVGMEDINLDEDLDVELDELLEIEKETPEDDFVVDEHPGILNTFTYASPTLPAPFYPPGLNIPSSKLRSQRIDDGIDQLFDQAFDHGNQDDEDIDIFEGILPAIMGIPVIMTEALLTDGELLLYGDPILKKYRCKMPSTLRTCWSSFLI